MNNQRTLALLAAACLLLGSGCVMFENPIAPPEDAQYDERLTGVWRYIEEEGEQVGTQPLPGLVHIGRAGEDAPEEFLEAIFIDHQEDDTLAPRATLAYTAQVGEQWYIVCTFEGFFQPFPTTWNERPSYYCVGRYEIIDEELLIYSVGENFGDILAGGELNGHDYEYGNPFAELNASTEELQAYVGEHDDLFGKEPTMRLRRVE